MAEPARNKPVAQLVAAGGQLGGTLGRLLGRTRKDKRAATGGTEKHAPQSGWRLGLREFATNRLALGCVGILVFFALFSFVGPLFYHTNQSVTNPLGINQPPSTAHLLGTDGNSFDELGRLMLGGQASLEVGLLSAFIAIVIGTLYGAVAGLVGGAVGGVMMRVVDILLSIPYLLVVLVLAEKFTATVVEESLLLGAFAWLVPARMIRGEVLTLRERDFVWASRVMGAKAWHLTVKHLIPNAISVTIVNVTFLIADAILTTAYLGFLGFGLEYPSTSWGDMLGNAQSNVSGGYWWLVYPVGGCLVVLVLSCNVIGDALRDAVDVRLRSR